MHLARISSIDRYDDLCRAEGLDPALLLSQAGLSLRQLNASNMYCAYTALSEALELASAACVEPLFGLKLAHIQSPLIFGELTLTMSQQATFEEAINTANRFLGVQAGGISLKLLCNRDRALLQFRSETCALLGYPQKIQMSVGQIAKLTEELLGLETPAFPISLRQAKPVDSRLQPNLLKRIRFNADYDGIDLPITWLAKKPRQNENAVRRHFENVLIKSKPSDSDDLYERMISTIGNLLPFGECTLHNVAKSLGLSERGLQYKLQHRGTRFDATLQRVRCTIAKQHLSESKVSITELALHLGYAEIAVFSRQFKKWTGLSPRDYRSRFSTL